MADGNILISQASGSKSFTVGTESRSPLMQAAVGRFMADHFMLGLGDSFYTDSRGYCTGTSGVWGR